jgi:radical SAM protein with 4Fe4S-binding SPASM domain
VTASGARCADDEIAASVDRSGVVTALQDWAHQHCSPLNATIELTQRCNIRCRHCYNFDRDEAKDACDERPELSTAEVKDAISALHRAGCLFLSFTGGEALLHPELFTFMKHAAGLNMAVQLLTNGLLLRPGMASELASYPNLLGVSVSLYGATAAVHDDITQVGGSFARTWAGAQLMRDKGVAVRLKYIVMRRNAHETAQMMADAEARGFPFSLDLTVTARHDGTRGSLETRIDEGQLEALYRGPLRPLVRLGPRPPVASEQFSCNCARGNCAITARGDVLPCISVPLVAGNIRQQPFEEIWASSPVFQQIRGLRLEDYPSCGPCGHKAYCTRERGAAMTYSGSYTGTDPLVCARASLVHRLADEVSDATSPPLEP